MPAIIDLSLLNISCVNVNSLRAHLHDVEIELSSNKTHVLALTETWLTPDIESSCVSIPNYNLIRNDRDLRIDGRKRYIQGGGIACYLDKSLIYTILECSNNVSINDPEYLFLDVKASSHNILIIIIYRRPEGHLLSEFLDKFNSYVSIFKNIIITGDLNFDLLNNSFESNYLQNFITDYSLFSVPFGPTHYSGLACSQLDVMIVDSSAKIVAFSKSSSPFAAGHCLISIQYQFDNLSRPQQTVTYRDFANCDYLSLSNDLVAHLRLKLSNLSPSETGNRASYLDPSEPTNSLKVLYDYLTSTLNTHAPFVTKQIVHRSIPWLTSNLRASIRKRDKLFMRAKR